MSSLVFIFCKREIPFLSCVFRSIVWVEVVGVAGDVRPVNWTEANVFMLSPSLRGDGTGDVVLDLLQI